MRCPYCSNKTSKVTDSRLNDVGIRRRRECLSCQRRFTTHERVQSLPLMVCKRDGRREEFSREKMISGLRKACAKRPVTARQIEQMVEDVEAEFQQNSGGEVSSDVLGTFIMDRLSGIDRVAYIRFASVHRNFEELESFERAVRDLREGNQLSLLDMPPDGRRTGRGRRLGTRSTNATHKSEAAPDHTVATVEAGHSLAKRERESFSADSFSEAVVTMGGDKE